MTTVVVAAAAVANIEIDCTDILAEAAVDIDYVDILVAEAHIQAHNHNLSAVFDSSLFCCEACEQESWQ